MWTGYKSEFKRKMLRLFHQRETMKTELYNKYMKEE